MAVKEFGVVRGKRMRVTRVDSCGLPQSGAGASLVTKGFIEVGWQAVMKDAEDKEQLNADGQLCIVDRTPPELKWFTVTMNFCNVNPLLLSFFTANPLVLDAAQNPVGYRSTRSVKVDGGAAVELWAGVGAADCDVPTDDSVLTDTSGGTDYAYFLSPLVKEGMLGDITINADVATFTVTALTSNAPRWGRGPYDVVLDEDGLPTRLLSPILNQEHLHVQSTPVPPPAVTDGAVELVLPSPYFGGTAPVTKTATLPGDLTGGTWTLTYGGQSTAGIAHNATAATVQAAFTALPTVGAGRATVTGSVGGPFTVVMDGSMTGPLTAVGTSLEPSGAITIV